MKARNTPARVRDFPQVPVRLSPDRMEKLQRIAAENERSVSAQARLFINQILDREQLPA